MPKTGITTLTVLAACAFAAACGPGVNLPGVHEPLDSKEWARCAEDLSHRETISLIDDLTLDSKTLLCEGVVLAASGKVEEGLELLAEAGVRDKEDHRPHYLAGRILGENKRYEEALTAFERSRARFAGMEVPTERLGRRVREKDGDDAARRFLLLADQRKLCPYGCQGLLAELHHTAGEIDEAEKIYERMVKLDPAEPVAYVGLARVANSRGDHVAESEFLTKATKAPKFLELGIGSQADLHYSHAFSRYNARKYSGAAASMERAFALIEGPADWRVLAGWIQLRLGNGAAALAEFDRAVAMDAKLPAARIGRGDALLEIGRGADAVAAFEQARELDRADAVVLLKLALAVAVEGDLARAQALFDDATRLDAAKLPQDLVQKIRALIDGGSQ
ncbi:MAG TPA: tetratricopeptide repeat protein [Polyangia bacterium]|nr:tetratricopeptide repeat protein [Polyangia bacterium]